MAPSRSAPDSLDDTRQRPISAGVKESSRTLSTGAAFAGLHGPGRRPGTAGCAAPVLARTAKRAPRAVLLPRGGTAAPGVVPEHAAMRPSAATPANPPTTR